jgi:YggT family protein
MGGSYFSNAGVFLVETLFDLYILTVMLRFLFQILRADFYNPMCQFVVKLTTPVLRPMRRWIPGFAGVDLAAVVLMLALKVVEIALSYAIQGFSPGLLGLMMMAVVGLLHLVVYVFLFAIFIRVLLSWIAPDSYSPMTALLGTLSEPLLRPARRLMPPIAGLDLSPIAVIILLQLILMLAVAPLGDLAAGLSRMGAGAG